MKFSFLVLLSCILAQAHAQTFSTSSGNVPVICSLEQGNNNSFILYAENKTFCTYTLKMNFSEIVGYSVSLSSDAIVNVEPGKHEIARFTRNMGSVPTTSLRYSFSIHRGQSLRKAPDSGFVYLLPSNETTQLTGIKVNAVTGRLVFDNYGRIVPDVSDAKEKEIQHSFQGTGFQYHKGNTIHAARAGQVI